MRVFGVLELALANKQYLVGNKVTLADVSFITWTNIALQVLLPSEVDAKANFPAVMRWHQSLLGLPYIAAALEEKQALSHRRT